MCRWAEKVDEHSLCRHHIIFSKCACLFCVVISFILDVGSAVLDLFFIARRIQPSLSLVDRLVEFCVPTNN